MAKKIKPVTPGLRFRIAPVFDEITSSNPEKSLLKTLKKLDADKKIKVLKKIVNTEINCFMNG